mmetsp:Transcript_13995/g.52279  ORF Transcript_13995/g.52279 Transcript_13995/m.52279 type:complete len:1062 (-) Transcript_13995:345-3530(-)
MSYDQRNPKGMQPGMDSYGQPMDGAMGMQGMPPMSNMQSMQNMQGMSNMQGMQGMSNMPGMQGMQGMQSSGSRHGMSSMPQMQNVHGGMQGMSGNGSGSGMLQQQQGMMHGGLQGMQGGMQGGQGHPSSMVGMGGQDVSMLSQQPPQQQMQQPPSQQAPQQQQQQQQGLPPPQAQPGPSQGQPPQSQLPGASQPGMDQQQSMGMGSMPGMGSSGMGVSSFGSPQGAMSSGAGQGRSMVGGMMGQGQGGPSAAYGGVPSQQQPPAQQPYGQPMSSGNQMQMGQQSSGMGGGERMHGSQSGHGFPEGPASQLQNAGMATPGFFGSLNNASSGNVNCYQQIVKLRQQQQAAGVDLSELSAVQLGLFPIPRCHHITKTLQTVQGLPSYRVRICKRCSGGNAHIELGTYADQESAIIVNDAHEILYGRTSRLLVLVPGDEEYFGSLMLRRFCRGRIETHRLTEVLREKLVVDAIKQSSRRKRTADADKSDEDKTIVLQPLRERRTVITKAVEETCRKFVIPVIVSSELGTGDEPEEFLEQLMLEGFNATTPFSKKLRRSPNSEGDSLEAAFASYLILFLGAYGSLSVTDLEDVTERVLAVFPSVDRGQPNDQLFVAIEEFKEKSFSKLQGLLDEGLRSLPVFCGSSANMLHHLKVPRWLHRQQQQSPSGQDAFDPERAMHTCVTESALLRKFHAALPSSRIRRISETEWASVEGHLHHCRAQVQHALARRAIVVGICAIELQEKQPWTERIQLALDTIGSVMELMQDRAMPDRSPVEQLEVRVVHCMLLDTMTKHLRTVTGHQPASLTAQFREAINMTLLLCKGIGLFSSRDNTSIPQAEQDARAALAAAEGGISNDADSVLSKSDSMSSDAAIFQRSTGTTFDSSANNMQQEYRVLVLSVVLGFCNAIGECNLNMQLSEGIHLSSVLREGADAAEWLEHICSSDCCLLLSVTARAFLSSTKTCLQLTHLDSNFGGLASNLVTTAGSIFQFCSTRFLYFERLVAEANDLLMQVNEHLENTKRRSSTSPASVPSSSGSSSNSLSKKQNDNDDADSGEQSTTINRVNL